MSTDALTLLKEDHKKVKALFRDFKGAKTSEERSRIATTVLEELTVHTYIENEILYPRIRKLVPDLEDDILESYEEHHVADLLLTELGEMTPTDERFEAKFTVLAESVRHHIGEEEEIWFPKVREQLSRSQLSEIGQDMQKLRSSAPRRPTFQMST